MTDKGTIMKYLYHLFLWLAFFGCKERSDHSVLILDSEDTVDTGTAIEAGTMVEVGMEVTGTVAGNSVEAGIMAEGGTISDSGTMAEAGTIAEGGTMAEAGTTAVLDPTPRFVRGYYQRLKVYNNTLWPPCILEESLIEYNDDTSPSVDCPQCDILVNLRGQNTRFQRGECNINMDDGLSPGLWGIDTQNGRFYRWSPLFTRSEWIEWYVIERCETDREYTINDSSLTIRCANQENGTGTYEQGIETVTITIDWGIEALDGVDHMTEASFGNNIGDLCRLENELTSEAGIIDCANNCISRQHVYHSSFDGYIADNYCDVIGADPFYGADLFCEQYFYDGGDCGESIGDFCIYDFSNSASEGQFNCNMRCSPLSYFGGSCDQDLNCEELNFDDGACQ